MSVKETVEFGEDLPIRENRDHGARDIDPARISTVGNGERCVEVAGKRERTRRRGVFVALRILQAAEARI